MNTKCNLLVLLCLLVGRWKRTLDLHMKILNLNTLEKQSLQKQQERTIGSSKAMKPLNNPRTVNHLRFFQISAYEKQIAKICELNKQLIKTNTNPSLAFLQDVSMKDASVCLWFSFRQLNCLFLPCDLMC